MITQVASSGVSGCGHRCYKNIIARLGGRRFLWDSAKKTKAAVLAGAMTLGASQRCICVFFWHGRKQKSNVFNIVAGRSDQKDTAGTILEPGWNPANAVDLEPGQEVTKDPSLKSNVEYQSWAFLQVEIPAVTAQKKGDLSDQVYDAVVLNGIDGAKWEKSGKIFPESRGRTACISTD